MSEIEPPRKRVIIAEDDPAIASLLARMLRNLYNIVIAEDGTGALAKAGTLPPPDLLLLDVMMPGLDGFTVAQRVRLLPGLDRVPIIFITARDAAPDVIKGIQLGARNYITKPFKLDDVLDKVKKVLRR